MYLHESPSEAVTCCFRRPDKMDELFFVIGTLR